MELGKKNALGWVIMKVKPKIKPWVFFPEWISASHIHSKNKSLISINLKGLHLKFEFVVILFGYVSASIFPGYVRGRRFGQL